MGIGKNKSIIPQNNYTFSLCIPSFRIIVDRSWENHGNVSMKTNRERKENRRIYANEPESQSHDKITHSTCVYRIWRFHLAHFLRKLWHKLFLERWITGWTKENKINDAYCLYHKIAHCPYAHQVSRFLFQQFLRKQWHKFSMVIYEIGDKDK